MLATFIMTHAAIWMKGLYAATNYSYISLVMNAPNTSYKCCVVFIFLHLHLTCTKYFCFSFTAKCPALKLNR